MPTENEVKFVLFLECEERINKLAEEKWRIHQGYLMAGKGTSLRIRKQADRLNKKFTYTLTFKSTVASGRVVEIEKRLDERDYTDLWPQCFNKLEKIRCILYDNNHEMWEIDFFKDHNQQTYFAMAEFEMPEGKIKPDFIPDFIKSNLLHEVALTDCRYASKLLADPRYATELLKNLEKKNDKCNNVPDALRRAK